MNFHHIKFYDVFFAHALSATMDEFCNCNLCDFSEPQLETNSILINFFFPSKIISSTCFCILRVQP